MPVSGLYVVRWLRCGEVRTFECITQFDSYVRACRLEGASVWFPSLREAHLTVTPCAT